MDTWIEGIPSFTVLLLFLPIHSSHSPRPAPQHDSGCRGGKKVEISSFQSLSLTSNPLYDLEGRRYIQCPLCWATSQLALKDSYLLVFTPSVWAGLSDLILRNKILQTSLLRLGYKSLQFSSCWHSPLPSRLAGFDEASYHCGRTI